MVRRVKFVPMSSDSASIDLTNHFLIAMPGLSDELFGQSVVFLCEHSERGALGLVINKPSDLSLSDLFQKLDLPMRREDLRDAPVFVGGPLQSERGFVLHEALGEVRAIGSDETPPAVARAIREALQGADPEPGEEGEPPALPTAYASTLCIPGGLEMTTSRDVLEAISSGAGPARVLVTLGYSSWGEGQLESEITENSWLTVPADPAVLFDTPAEQRYARAMGLLGLEPWMLSRDAGHA
jgi:putative transcriptional regulator